MNLHVLSHPKFTDGFSRIEVEFVRNPNALFASHFSGIKVVPDLTIPCSAWRVENNASAMKKSSKKSRNVIIHQKLESFNN